MRHIKSMYKLQDYPPVSGVILLLHMLPQRKIYVSITTQSDTVS